LSASGGDTAASTGGTIVRTGGATSAGGATVLGGPDAATVTKTGGSRSLMAGFTVDDGGYVTAGAWHGWA
jgi:hypothetical protein